MVLGWLVNNLLPCKLGGLNWLTDRKTDVTTYGLKWPLVQTVHQYNAREICYYTIFVEMWYYPIKQFDMLDWCCKLKIDYSQNSKSSGGVNYHQIQEGIK